MALRIAQGIVDQRIKGVLDHYAELIEALETKVAELTEVIAGGVETGAETVADEAEKVKTAAAKKTASKAPGATTGA